MWLFLLAWVGICVLLILLYHIWLGLNKWPESGEQPEMMELAKQRITWTKPSPTRDDGIIRVLVRKQECWQEMNAHGNENVAQMEEEEAAEEEEGQMPTDNVPPSPIVENNNAIAIEIEHHHQGIVEDAVQTQTQQQRYQDICAAACSLRSKIGQGPIRFTKDVNDEHDEHCRPSTSAARPSELSTNSALCAFFAQFLSNLGVNLSDGNVFIFAEQDHNIVWIHLGRGANNGLYAIHENNFDDNVTELLEKFMELFVPGGLLPYELAWMPRAFVDSASAERRLNCNICLTAFNIGEHMTELKCQHFYHSECIHAWLLTRNTCPTCRAIVFFDDPNKAVKKLAGVYV